MTSNITAEIVRTMTERTRTGQMNWVNINRFEWITGNLCYSNETAGVETRITDEGETEDLVSINRAGLVVAEARSGECPELRDLMGQAKMNIQNRINTNIRILEALGQDTSRINQERDDLGEIAGALAEATRASTPAIWERLEEPEKSVHRIVIAGVELRVITGVNRAAVITGNTRDGRWAGSANSDMDRRVRDLRDAVEGKDSQEQAKDEARTPEPSEDPEKVAGDFLKALQELE